MGVIVRHIVGENMKSSNLNELKPVGDFIEHAIKITITVISLRFPKSLE